jgi:hypothetical protein
MKQNEIKTLELVRRIRDEQAELLQDKSVAEIQAFFRQEAEAANEEAMRLLRKHDTSLHHTGDQAESTASR